MTGRGGPLPLAVPYDARRSIATRLGAWRTDPAAEEPIYPHGLYLAVRQPGSVEQAGESAPGSA